MLSAFFAKPLVRILGSYLLVLCLGVGLGVYGHSWWTTPKTVTEIRHDVTYVSVPGKDTITYQDVTKTVVDKTEVAKLLAEQTTLKNTVAVLTETIANFTPTVTAGPTVFVDKPGASEAHFKDWRLTFDAVEKQPTVYSLNQKFEALSTIGKDAAGKPAVSVKLFEIGPGETRTVLTDTKTTAVIAVPSVKHWFISPSVQAGFGYTHGLIGTTTKVGLTTVTTPAKNVAGGVVGLQWLKRGSTKAAEDLSFSLLTPAVFISSGILEPALLPVSVNLGRIPHQPFSDLWVSPLVGFNKAGTSRVGIVITATF